GEWGLRPALSLCAPVVQVREIAAGTPVGYGGDFVAQAPMRVGVLPIGYADGFARALRDLPLTLLHGGRAYPTRVLGRVCMDQTMVDLTHTPARVGDTVVLWRDVHRPAALLDTIPYEIFTALSARLDRKEAPCDRLL
ncbi:MAG: bifunctional UDP-N-acetylmuramoyl-tripeptide:D-alanyl-D-alanine ligase/alanine racemase, partial [Clostridia bacterium]|nr:bifunctional UDP-N-acetylmuramoyl-tripeptide:D-alanyl-D-alanine ligase/alanine racemase [Clostridia bacterium]